MNGQPQQQQLPTPQEAYTITSSAVRQLKLSLDEHIVLQNCLLVLQELVQPKPQVAKVLKPSKGSKNEPGEETILTE